MEFVKLILMALAIFVLGIGGGATTVAVVELIWPSRSADIATEALASRAVVTKGDRLDRADLTCWTSDGRAARCR